MEILKNKNKVLLGLSGGVDSTAAALLLQEKGYEVIGYFFDVTGKNKEGREETEKLAEQLGIQLICEDVSKEFSEIVIDNFCSEYMAGRTPNPCIICNPTIKFKKLIETADRIGVHYIATGHYCRIAYDENTDKYFVRQGANTKKDQSYMLYRLGQDVLSRVIFPLGDFTDKDEIRQIARENALKNAEKKDSQEICFIEDDDYAKYIGDLGYVSKPGNFVNSDGKILGTHKGILNYTIGQRKGLGIALGKPAFVTKIDCKTNQVTLGDNDDLFSNTVECGEAFFADGNPEFWTNKKLTAKPRYSAKFSEVSIEVDDKKITATFKEPQRAATPGQSIVFYHDDLVVGGGFIK